MVIGAPKRDAHDQDSKPMKSSGVTPDEAEAIVLAATRGASPANVFSNKHKNNLGVTSNGSFSSLNDNGLISKPVSTSDANNSGQLNSGQFHKIDSVDVVKAIAKSVVNAASYEGDSSEVSLSKEQKLKAERLKRAKIFAAMIKSGQEPMTELIQAPTTTHSTLSEAESDPVLREREGSSVPSNCEISDVKRSSQRDSSVLDHDREHKHSRKKRSRSRLDENDSEEDHGHCRKKRSSRSRADESDSGDDHRHSRKMRSSRSRAADSDSEEDHRHYRKRHHSESSSAKHHKRQSSKESRHHRHRHHDSSEDEQRHMRHSKSRQRHKSDELSDADDQERKRSSRHHRSTHAHFETEVPSIEDEKTSENLLKEAHEVGGTDGSHAGPSVDTEIPSELRAKIRNMLLEIM
ncbi:hypothetical protein IHE45_20G028900 [Dioscorea alata]|uniref:Uncharacterized protein n=1 Tax=Dioscorea alata TaxID=55571 RepID=A0ACB7TR86_DIOAL|nr:hypothetical protein IHE45_20G028900 [Dioscorea alata]